MGAIGSEAEEAWKQNPDMIPEGSVVLAKMEQEEEKIKKSQGLTDGQKFLKFVILGMAMHSGIVAFAP